MMRWFFTEAALMLFSWRGSSLSPPVPTLRTLVQAQRTSRSSGLQCFSLAFVLSALTTTMKQVSEREGYSGSDGHHCPPV